MRKLSAILFCAIYIALYPRPAEVYNLPLFCEAEVLLYADKLPAGIDGAVFNGLKYEIKTDLKHAGELSKKACAKYITVIFDGDIEYVKRYLNIQSAEIMLLNEGELISGYCHIIGCSPVKGKNVQIYHKNGRIYIGCPSIFGSY